MQQVQQYVQQHHRVLYVSFLLGVFLEGICLVTSTGWDRMVSCGVVYGLLDSSPVASATFTEIPQQSTRQQRRVSEAVVVAVAEARAWLIIYRYSSWGYDHRGGLLVHTYLVSTLEEGMF